MGKVTMGPGSSVTTKASVQTIQADPAVIYIDRPTIEYVDRVVEVDKIVEVVVEKIVEIDRIVSVPFYTEKIVEVIKEKIVEVPVEINREIIRLIPDVAGVNRYKELLIREANQNRLLKLALTALVLLSIIVGVL